MVFDREYQEKYMTLADTLYEIPPENFVRATTKQLKNRGYLDLSYASIGAASKFNMSFLNAQVHDCGTVCCALGWGYSLFGEDWEPAGASEWLYDANWANRLGADTPQAAAHRIWYWITKGCFRGTDTSLFKKYCTPAGWAKFVVEHPILECKAKAIKFQRDWESDESIM